MPSADGPLYIVLNARSGRQQAATLRATIGEVIERAGRRHVVVQVDRPAKLASMAREAAERARASGGVLVAAGGDGTINAVAHAALPLRCAFGVLPQGTFNYFSRVHGIPLDIADAARLLLDAAPQPVQVGLVNDRLFLVNASVGLYPRLLEDREAYKRQYGRSRIIALWSALKTLLRGHRPLHLSMQRDGQPAEELRTPTLFVGNNRLQLEQVGIPEAPQAGAGALAAIGVRPVGRPTLFSLLARGAVGQLGSADEVFSFAFEQLVVEGAGRAGKRLRYKIATDGEVTWLRAPLHFRIAPEPLWLLKPAAPAAGAPA